jgi:membrane protein YdbS with pleckstrin-like domain
MAKIEKKKNVRSVKKALVSPFSIYWNSKNYLILIVGIIIAIIGFYLLSVPPWDSSSALVVSPIILFIAYLIVIPFAIFYKKRNNSETSPEVK